MAKKAAGEQNNLQTLKEQLKTGAFSTCYVLYGDEDYLRGYYLERLRKKLLNGPAEEFNHHRFTKEGLDWDAVSAAVEAMPMMAERSLVEISDVDLYKEPEPSRVKLIAMLQDIPDYCCVVFTYDTIAFSPDKRLKKLHEALTKAALLVEFAHQSPQEMRAWIRRHALAGGKDIDVATCDHLAFVTDNSMTAMNSELLKLTAYATGPLITKQDINAVVEPTLTAVTFDISNAVADGDYERALLKLRDLMKMQEEPILILGAIAAQMRKLHCAKVLMDNGKGGDSLMRLAGMGDYPARLTMAAARKLTTRFCDRAVLLCLEVDRSMKSSYDAPERLLELLLVRLAQEARS